MNNSYLLDIHTHTIASGHAYGTIREMALAASEKGLQLLGISEHGPEVPGTCDPIYFSNLYAVPKYIYGVEILHGCEINILDDHKIHMEQRYLKHLDYLIAGIHRFGFHEDGIENNTNTVIEYMKYDKVYFIAHPDDGKVPLDYEKLIQAAKQYHVALEINNNSFRKLDRRLNCIENYQTILKLCMKYQVPIIVNSDAHDPSLVGDVERAYDLIESMHFDHSFILNEDINAFKRFISYQK